MHMPIIEFTQRDVLAQIPKRKLDSHKGDYGRILLLCGSRGYTGAPELAAKGALRTGAGLVYLCVPDSIYQIVACKLTEPIVYPVPDNDGTYCSAAIKKIAELLPRMDAVLVGPGIGKSEGSRNVVEFVLNNFEGPIVLDADGINAIKTNIDILRSRKFPTVLTPHMGEFENIGGDVHKNKAKAATELALDLNSIVVLKGRRTIITDGKACFEINTGNPGMAVGGSGDVLAGIITSLIAQHMSPLTAAACGAWLNGAAGDACAAEMGQYGMLPSDYVNYLPRLMY